MRKAGWAAAGLGPLVLLLAACGGSPGSTSAVGASTATQSTASASVTTESPSTGQTTKPGPAPNSSTARPTQEPTPVPHNTAGPQPSSSIGSYAPVGTTVMVVQNSDLGYILAEANGYVVYTYAKDKKGGAPTCTGTCAQTWVPVTGMPQESPADTIPGTFGLVTGAGGVKQITYNGYPLYRYKPAPPRLTTGNGIGGVWHVIKLSASDITG